MKIAIILPSLHYGGVERVMLNLANNLSREMSVDLLLLENAEGEFKPIVSGEINKVIEINESRAIKALPRLIKYMRYEKPDAVIGSKDYINIILLWARRAANTPTKIIATVHINPTVSAKELSGLKNKMIPLAIKKFYHWADSVVAVSQGVREDLVNNCGVPSKLVKVIYNPVVDNKIFELADENIDHPWIHSKNYKLILAVGRLTEQKDFPTLVRAFWIVHKKYPVRLMILGEGEDRGLLERMLCKMKLQNYVQLPGYVGNPYKYMKHSSVYVLSSRREGLPTTLIEAMALGVPVVSTDCPSGPREILGNGRWGYLVPIGDEQEMANAIIKNLQKPPQSQVLKDRANMFSVDNAVKAYLNILHG